MNSMSKKYYDSCEKHSYEKEEKCPTIVKCGCPSTVGLPLISLDNVNITIASLRIDTSCVCDPVIKVDFASVFTTTVSGNLGISVQLYKQCGNQPAFPVGPSWQVLGIVDASDKLAAATPISFFVCDNDCGTDTCCVYTVVATVSGPLADVNSSFNNSTLAATITCRSNECQRKCKR